MNNVTSDLVLTLNDVNLKIKDKDILQNIYAEAKSGELVALMGPTGCGKTSFLNIISGRQHADTGTVTLNGNPFNKRQRRRLAFVQQQDVFFSQLSLWETLWFTARLRLPERLTDQEKKERIERIVDLLNIRKCLKTVIGDAFVRGLSGGEKKRASIACELLVDPDILLMDEPTSGLDSSTANIVMKAMKDLCRKLNKMMVVSIHQPSSQLYHLFDKLVLLSQGRVVYFGPASLALDRLEKIGPTFDPQYNPADYFLDLCTGDEEMIEKLKLVGEDCMTNMMEASSHATGGTWGRRSMKNGALASPTEDSSEARGLLDMNGAGQSDKSNGQTVVQFETEIKEQEIRDKWPTSWCTQYRVLSDRSLKQTVRVLLQGYEVAMAASVSIVTALIYWNTGMSLDTYRDVIGMIFFCVGYWTFLPAMGVVASYPAESGVINKERAAGAYRLSAYYFARMTGELPLLSMPIVMYTAMYWASGISGITNYFASLAIMIFQTLAFFGFGLLVTVSFSDIRMAISVMFSYLISGYIAGGFFTRHMPFWMGWCKYVTAFFHPYGATVTLVVSDMGPKPCNQTNIISFPQCAEPGIDYVYPVDILRQNNIELPIKVYLLTMVAYFTVIRVGAYIVLRFKKRKPV